LYTFGTEAFTVNFILLCVITAVGLNSSFETDYKTAIPFVEPSTLEKPCQKGWGLGIGCFIANAVHNLEDEGGLNII